MTARLDSLKPGDCFRWAGGIFEVADEPPFEHLSRPYRRVIYREACGGIAANGDTGIMPCAETVELIHSLRSADSDAPVAPEPSQEANHDPDRGEPTAENRRRGDTPVDEAVGASVAGETSPVTAGAIPAAGAVRFLLFYRDGDQVWQSGMYDDKAEADECVQRSMRFQSADFADSYQIVPVQFSGRNHGWLPFECTNAETIPAGDSEVLF